MRVLEILLRKAATRLPVRPSLIRKVLPLSLILGLTLNSSLNSSRSGNSSVAA